MIQHMDEDQRPDGDAMTGALTRLRVRGLCSLADVDLQPGRLTVLIGSNGSGKSNLLRALKLAALLRTHSLQRFVGDEGGAAALLHYGPKRTQAIDLELEFKEDNRRNHYNARLGFAAGDRLLFLEETVSFQRGEGLESSQSLGAGHWESLLHEASGSSQTAKSVNWWLSQLNYFHFHDTSMASALRTSSRAEDDRYVRSNGSNLASYLARLANSDEEADRAAWRRINDLIRRVAPCVKMLQPSFDPLSKKPHKGVRLDWIDDRDELFGVHQLSDGTLRAVALITALAQPTARLPRLISIDEPELGLHPAAIAIIAELARSVSHRCQVLFATQSTTFLDHFLPQEIVVAERDNGATRLTRPDTEALNRWLEDYSLSEVFEKGVIGGRP